MGNVSAGCVRAMPKALACTPMIRLVLVSVSDSSGTSTGNLLDGAECHSPLGHKVSRSS